jgi:hypothetical protein
VISRFFFKNLLSITITPKKYNDIHILKVKGQISYKSKLKISPFTNLPLSRKDSFVYFSKQIAPKFLDMHSYSSSRGAKRSSIVFPPIFMLLVWFYMHDTL